jgi:predicted transcriptional regulator of viral defense system
MGSAQFRINGLTYYVTRRDPKGVQQTQRRQLNPYCRVTVTGLEQTLLDCLHRPGSSGGASVVFEAWAAGMERSTPERIVELAKKIGDPLLLRRTGYMIAQYEPTSPVLTELLKQIGDESHAPELMPSLLPGIPYQQVNSTWLLRTP